MAKPLSIEEVKARITRALEEREDLHVDKTKNQRT